MREPTRRTLPQVSEKPDHATGRRATGHAFRLASLLPLRSGQRGVWGAVARLVLLR